MKFGSIGPIAIHLPETVEDNDMYSAEFPKWNMELIYAKTGVRKRHIASPDQCASDLAVAAAEKLFGQHQIDRSTIDFLLLCTQTPRLSAPHHRLPDPGPARAAHLGGGLGFQSRLLGLHLRSVAGRRADPKRGCQPGPAHHRETYSKYIHPTDRSLRTIFGDGAAATLVEACERAVDRARSSSAPTAAGRRC